MTSNTVKRFVIADPRTFEGDPYEAAARACAQIEAVLGLIEAQLPATRIMVRNAELSRQMIEGEPDPAAWEKGPAGRNFDKAADDLKALRRAFRTQGIAAGFDPKARV